MNRLELLFELQRETIGATFALSYSVKRKVYAVRFNNLHKKIEHPDLNECLALAVGFILGHRQNSGDANIYTLYGFRE